MVTVFLNKHIQPLLLKNKNHINSYKLYSFLFVLVMPDQIEKYCPYYYA